MNKMSSSKNQTNKDATPYPGLRYYEDSEALFFAGRENDARKCTHLLSGSPVVILHGRSGCGKSSFLRAGVKPIASEALPGRTFPENFEVVRCTENPLKSFAEMLLRVCEDFIRNEKDNFWKPKKSVELEDIRDFEDIYRARKKEMPTSARATCAILEKLCRLLRSVPIFVIDQAEEVFTHEEKRSRELAELIKLDAEDANADGGSDKSANDQQARETEARRDELNKKGDELKDAAREFFNLLALVANDEAGGAKLVISLRTEYKGQFDDRIRRNDKNADKFQGFYLEDLTVQGLKTAIERPTLGADEWKKVRGSEGQPAPLERWKFRFDEGVAERLAKMLINTKKVPEGGVLPTLQIACLRLWEQARRSKTA